MGYVLDESVYCVYYFFYDNVRFSIFFLKKVYYTIITNFVIYHFVLDTFVI